MAVRSAAVGCRVDSRCDVVCERRPEPANWGTELSAIHDDAIQYGILSSDRDGRTEFEPTDNLPNERQYRPRSTAGCPGLPRAFGADSGPSPDRDTASGVVINE